MESKERGGSSKQNNKQINKRRKKTYRNAKDGYLQHRYQTPSFFLFPLINTLSAKLRYTPCETIIRFSFLRRREKRCCCEVVLTAELSRREVLTGLNFPEGAGSVNRILTVAFMYLLKMPIRALGPNMSYYLPVRLATRWV